MTSADIIASLALLVSSLSALYSRWASNEAKRANDLSLHNQRKEIYDAFFELKMTMQTNGIFAGSEAPAKFYYPAKNAVVYLPKDLAECVTAYQEICFKIVEILFLDSTVTDEKSKQFKELSRTERELSAKIDTDFIELLQKPLNSKNYK